jgi:hypothetical protein
MSRFGKLLAGVILALGLTAAVPQIASAQHFHGGFHGGGFHGGGFHHFGGFRHRGFGPGFALGLGIGAAPYYAAPYYYDDGGGWVRQRVWRGGYWVVRRVWRCF